MSIVLGGKNRQNLVYFWVFQREALSDPPPPLTNRGSPWDQFILRQSVYECYKYFVTTFEPSKSKNCFIPHIS